MAFLRQLAKRTLTAVLPRDAVVTRGHSAGVALTFDDGPHPEHTPRLLDVLAETGITATFFIVGECAQARRDILKRVADAGHEVGNHTWSHSEPRHTSTLQMLDEVRRTRELIEDVTGRNCCLFRPPKGELTPRKILALLREQQTVVLWNCDTKDYQLGPGSEQIVDWCLSYQPAPGDIVLMHDNHPHASVAVETLDRIRTGEFTDSRERYLFRTVSQMLHRDKQPVAAGRE